MSRTTNSIRKAWTLEEDNVLLLQLIDQYGTNANWPRIALSMESRTGKQCRERYINHLDPDMKKTAWTIEEDTVIRDMFPEFGTKWSQYMPALPGRSDNAIKNRYHMISRKRSVSEVSTDFHSHDENMIQNGAQKRPRHRNVRPVVVIDRSSYLDGSSSPSDLSAESSDQEGHSESEDTASFQQDLKPHPFVLLANAGKLLNLSFDLSCYEVVA